MDIGLNAKDTAFRDEVREFLDEALTEEMRAAARLDTGIMTEVPVGLMWQKALHAKGWAAPSWPEEHGGPGWTPMQQFIFQTECARAEAPRLSPLGLGMVGPAIMGHGSDEQKAFYLPRILAGEDIWCQGYSEPGSGSDLASLQCRAVRDGDEYVVNGTKIWTTNAHYANRIFCLVRTDTESKPQAGISFLLIDMEQPGVTVKPIITLAGNHEVNQVFFDDARAPLSDRVGAENDGWTVAKYLLEFERGGSAYGVRLNNWLAKLKELAGRPQGADGARLADDPDFAGELADVEVQLAAMEYTEHRAMAEIAARGRPGPTSSMLKVRGTELAQSLTELAVRAIGYYAAPDDFEARQPGSNVAPVSGPDEMVLMPRYLDYRAATIYGGSNEIQRNIMAKLVLGM